MTQLMTAYQYYYSAFDGFNEKELFKFQECVWIKSVSACGLDLLSSWGLYFSVNDIYACFIANKAIVILIIKVLVLTIYVQTQTAYR